MRRGEDGTGRFQMVAAYALAENIGKMGHLLQAEEVPVFVLLGSGRNVATAVCSEGLSAALAVTVVKLRPLTVRDQAVFAP